MSNRAFYTLAAREDVGELIAKLEQDTHVEIVVAVRQRSGSYRHADYLAGAVLALIVLAAMLFSPVTFSTFSMPVDLAIIFVIGVLISARTDWIRRLFSTEKERRENVKVHAQAAFWDLGVARTKRRIGALVYVSLFEREVELLLDDGIPGAHRDARFVRARERLRACMGGNYQLEKFLEAMRQLGADFRNVLPCTRDEKNENELLDLVELP